MSDETKVDKINDNKSCLILEIVLVWKLLSQINLANQSDKNFIPYLIKLSIHILIPLI